MTCYSRMGCPCRRFEKFEDGPLREHCKDIFKKSWEALRDVDFLSNAYALIGGVLGGA